ncbi:MAG: gas vesicle protein [Planctomycetota bacterium]
MAVIRNNPAHQTNSTNVADLLERILDKGVVIAGDIKVSLLDIELLTVQIRLVVCSIDKAKEMGMDWWANSPVFGNEPKLPASEKAEVAALTERLAVLESQLAERKPEQAGPQQVSAGTTSA